MTREIESRLEHLWTSSLDRHWFVDPETGRHYVYDPEGTVILDTDREDEAIAACGE